jgi:hypothetical protein
VPEIISLIHVHLVTTKVGAKHELLFNKPAQGQVKKDYYRRRMIPSATLFGYVPLLNNLYGKLYIFDIQFNDWSLPESGLHSRGRCGFFKHLSQT